MTVDVLDHYAVRERWGPPDACEGNVNDPRTHEENGVRYNEKWIYFLPGGEQRLVYWHRYDCRGVLRQGADGAVSQEAI